VSHNTVTINGSNVILKDTTIDITIKNVLNPAIGTTADFKMGHLNSAGTYLGFTDTFGTVTIVAQGTGMAVRLITATADNTFDSPVSYKFELYPSTTIDTNKEMRLHFPSQFDLWIRDGATSYDCTTTYRDGTKTAATATEIMWNTDSACAANYNWITLDPPATSRSF
jgi:hypothetical protein